MFFFVSFFRQAEEDKMKIVNDCKTQEKATDADLQAMKEKKGPPTTPTGKCFVTCLFEKHGAVSTLFTFFQFYSNGILFITLINKIS